MPNVSASWNASLPISLVETCPVMRDDRDRIHHGVHQAGDQVGGAGTGGGAADADFAGGARIAFGREAGVLFVPHQDVADVVIVERVVERQRDAARDSRRSNRRLRGPDTPAASSRRSSTFDMSRLPQ